MSGISVTFSYLGGETTNQINIQHKIGEVVTTYPLYGVIGAAFDGTQFIQSTTGPTKEADTAFNFGLKFQAAYAPNIPGLDFEIIGNTARLVCTSGEFQISASSGNLYQVSFAIDDQLPLSWQVQELFDEGDCGIVKYQIDYAFGGAKPYEVSIFNNGNRVIDPDYDGNQPLKIDVQRGFTTTIYLKDQADGELRFSFRSPERLRASDFSYRISQFQNSSDVIVSHDIKREGTFTEEEPIQYAVVPASLPVDEVINFFQVSNVFPNLAPGAYRFFAMDRYGCYENTGKNIIISEFNPIPADPQATENYFEITELNSLSFKRDLPFSEFRRNYDQTLSYQEAVLLPYQEQFYFEEGYRIQTQFKSSYPFHAITVFKCDGTRESIPFQVIQQNTNIFEKVDAVAFTHPDYPDNIAIYFDGGNTYTPETDVINGESPYRTDDLPPWAIVGSDVELLGYGARRIVQTDLYDAERNISFMLLDGVLGFDELPVTIQVRYSRHPYNVYHFEYTMHQGSGYIIIEPGFTADAVVAGERRMSETFYSVNDFDKWVEITWSLNRSVEHAVAYDSFEGKMWMKARFRPYAIGEAETLRADDRTRSLNQEHRYGYRLDAKLVAPRKWNKLGSVSAIGNRGTVIIEDVEVVRVTAMEQEELSYTNKSNVVIEFEPARPRRSLNFDSVLDPPIGTPEEPYTPPDISSNIYIRSALVPGRLLTTTDGRFIIAGQYYRP